MSDAALDATADALARRALAGLPAEPTRADLTALAPPLARLLHARLDAELDRAAPASTWVDADATADARNAWREAAESVLRIPADQREAVVRRATERALTHLIRPADTLAAVAFEGEAGPLPAGAALERIRAFGPYPYLVQITERYIERKGLSHIDRAGLERLIRRIDRRMVSAFGADDWMALLEPLFAWVGPTGRPPGTIPAGLLRSLFQAKGAAALHDTLDEIDAVDAETLRGLMKEALGSAEQAPAPQAPPPTSAPEPPTPEPVAEVTEPEPVAAPSPAPEPIAEPEPDSVTEFEPDSTIWSTTPPLPPPTERQHGPWETEAPTDPLPSPDVSDPDAEVETANTDEASDEHRPPVIGSRYGAPEVEPGDSSVLGPARPLDPMEAVRDAVIEPEDVAPDNIPEIAHLGEPAEIPAPPVLDVEPIDEPEDSHADAPAPAEPAAPEPTDDEPLWQRLARGRDTEPVPVPETEPPTDAPDDQPLWKRFAQSDLAERLPEADTPRPPASPAEPSAAKPTATLADSFMTPPPPSPESPAEPRLPLDDLEERVLGTGARERRDWFVTELFGGSPGGYHRTLGAIDAAPTYTDATAVISSEILRKRSVSPYTDCAVAFIDAVQASFERR